MKILYLPLINRSTDGASEQYDLAEAFKREFETEVFDFLDDPAPELTFAEIVRRFKPDIVHMQLQETRKIFPPILQQLKQEFPNAIFSNWSGDVRKRIMPEVVEVGQVIDYTLLSNTGQLPLYSEAIGKPCFYFQNAVGPSFFYDNPPGGTGIVFIGNNYHVEKNPALSSFPDSPERWEMAHALFDVFPEQFRLYGMGWPRAHGKTLWREQTQVYAQAQVTIGHNNINSWSYYFSDRQLIAMAAGRPHVCRYTPQLEEIFEDGKECLFWRTIPECIDRVQWCLNNPEEATNIGLQGQERVRKEHTWEVRVQEYERIIGL